MKVCLIILFINFAFCFPLMAKTLFLGDSLTAVYEKSAKYVLDEKIEAEYVSGSGLINKSKKDWIAFVNNFDLREFDNVIISLGTNDFVQYGSDERQKYYSLVFQLIAEIQNENPLATIIWISPPHLKNPEHEHYLIHTRHIIKHSAMLLNIHYLDINQPHILGTQWQPVIHHETVRTDDGIHITRKGGERVIREVVKNPEWTGLTKVEKMTKN
ncbi:SGNH/GDSL hydrolase family protein [Escherichia coli]|nr:MULTISPECIES: SGNH/GDSL hydrolase family protein [Enterobacterales]MCN3658432.1 SGNH/GDSL hydrolase family protein [Escherichia coli]MCN6920613.1 SGNH/GDSL hydrolase family protein [Escherichia coli]MCV1595274.1 SGNH/GDSL hydrolase family protein [Escherichia coli]MCV2044510.1 SGNH/GDSL hydrolase family protein [Escherichia coli]MDB8048613.1 SGNH/GDSL hydrolase family protein [Escherichia coli]